MTLTDSPKQYALLVGIDMYLNDGSRKNEKNGRLSFSRLCGCVNDVHAIEEYLQREFRLDDSRVLTASSPSVMTHDAVPLEPPSMWPTFHNIKREFDSIYELARPGDGFFFHFSGHGSRLQPTSKSPPGRSVDPSLITVDFCNGKPAIRGWQLNEWLKKFNEKHIRTIVILDSCYSGGGWRDGMNVRTTEDWTNVPNTTADEDIITETFSETSYRDGELPLLWGINPEAFTLMAACESHQKAMETMAGDKQHGAFTYELLACLKNSPPSKVPITYRGLRDQISKELHQQTPRVYGRDGLLFFSNTEPLSATPVVAWIKHRCVTLPIGKFHGVNIGSEFSTYRMPYMVLSIDDVDDFQCTASITTRQARVLEQCMCELIPSRWSLGGHNLRVYVHRTLGYEFRRTLHGAMQERIIGNIEVCDIDNDDDELDTTIFRLKKSGDGGIAIFGPSSLMGYDGPLRGASLVNEGFDQLARKAAAILSHLNRFSQILNLQTLCSPLRAPFDLCIKREGKASSSWDISNKVKFQLVNHSQSPLRFTILVLGPGFHVKQLYPTENSSASIEPRGTISFSFKIVIPDALRSHSDHRDIIRTVVTEEESLSWKNIELPHIWNTGQLEHLRHPEAFGRDALFTKDPCVWIRDEVILTGNWLN
jgi:hypothetical protein